MILVNLSSLISSILFQNDIMLLWRLVTQNQTPRVLKAFFLLIVTVLIFVGITNSVLSNGPKGIISLFSKFNLRPDMISNYLKSSMNAGNESIS